MPTLCLVDGTYVIKNFESAKFLSTNSKWKKVLLSNAVAEWTVTNQGGDKYTIAIANGSTTYYLAMLERTITDKNYSQLDPGPGIIYTPALINTYTELVIEGKAPACTCAGGGLPRFRISAIGSGQYMANSPYEADDSASVTEPSDRSGIYWIFARTG